MSKYILHYFPANGRGMISRAILCYVHADWTNDVIKKEDWPKIKKSGLFEFEQVPILEVDGKRYSQSHAIELYLAEKFNLMGKDIEENYQIRSLLFATDDYRAEIRDVILCKDETKKPELIKIGTEKLNSFWENMRKGMLTLEKISISWEMNLLWLISL
jgi:glutathione S-transferase